MEGLMKPSSKLSSIIAASIILLLGLLAGVAHGGGKRRLISSHDGEPCKRMTVYYHDILYNGENNANATSAAATQPTALSRSVSINDTFFGQLIVFDDVVTAEQALRSRWRARRASTSTTRRRRSTRGSPSPSSSTPRRTGARSRSWAPIDLIFDKTRDFSVVGGTGDFFMARGVATVRTDSYEGLYYFRLKMDVKLYECYV